MSLPRLVHCICIYERSFVKIVRFVSFAHLIHFVYLSPHQYIEIRNQGTKKFLVNVDNVLDKLS